jgi:thiamine-monophosphate kinase
LKHLGYKAVVVNLSDIAAMNAVPTQILVSMAVSNRFPVEALDEIYDGIYRACEKYNVDLVGGDDVSAATAAVKLTKTAGEWIAQPNQNFSRYAMESAKAVLMVCDKSLAQYS